MTDRPALTQLTILLPEMAERDLAVCKAHYAEHLAENCPPPSAMPPDELIVLSCIRSHATYVTTLNQDAGDGPKVLH